MTHHNHHGGALGAFAIVAAITFAFGARTARIVVGTVLIAGVAFFAFVMFLIVAGKI